MNNIDERQQRQYRACDLLRDADRHIIRCDWTDALAAIEYARQLVMAELLIEERDQMREEMARSELAELRRSGL